MISTRWGRRGTPGIALAALALLAASARGGDPFGRWHGAGAPPPGKPRPFPNTPERAGFPRCLGTHVQATNTSGGIGYYVGGGAWHHGGEPRCREEGTWGWDETGHPWLRRRVVLGWWHGRKFQGGTGRYATDGPPVPDAVAGTIATFENLHDR